MSLKPPVSKSHPFMPESLSWHEEDNAHDYISLQWFQIAPHKSPNTPDLAHMKDRELSKVFALIPNFQWKQ